MQIEAAVSSASSPPCVLQSFPTPRAGCRTLRNLYFPRPPCSAPNSLGVPNRNLSLQCPTAEYRRVSLQCQSQSIPGPTAQYPRNAQLPSMLAVHNRRVFQRCRTAEYSISATVSQQCPTAERPSSAQLGTRAYSAVGFQGLAQEHKLAGPAFVWDFTAVCGFARECVAFTLFSMQKRAFVL